MTTDIITTHFDYHSIDANLLKLDILGHDDPTMIRMLEDLTHLDAKTIPLEPERLCPCSRAPQALGISRRTSAAARLDALGSRSLVQTLLSRCCSTPSRKSFSDLIRISGLSHGTDVWLGNAQT